MSSVIVYMNAPEDSAGYATKERPGMAVRMTVADDILDDGIDLFCEIMGGTAENRQEVVDRLVKFYDATYKVTRDRDDYWCANVCLQDVNAARQNPLFDAVMAQREWADRFVMVYEAGMLVLRVDFPEGLEADKEKTVADTLRGAAKLSDPTATARVGTPTHDLEGWRPLSDITPSP